MARDKRSFFERLTGTVHEDDFEFEDDLEEKLPAEGREKGLLSQEESAVGELTVDMYQTPTHIIIKSMVAGVRPEDLDVSIARDMVTIKGKREQQVESNGDDYFFRELYWGTFSRTILLPQEIEVEGAEAVEKHGLLVIRLPKMNKDKQTKLRVRSN